MSVFASAAGLNSGPNTALKRALRELATVPAPGTVSQKKASSTRSDEARGQQLRGIFAAFDEDRDGLLNEGELTSALLSLGIDPTHATLARYAKASPLGASAIDFASFLKVCLSRDGDDTRLPSTLTSVVALLAELDTGKTGRIPLATLLHALAEVHAPTRLSLEEVQELLRLTGILTPATMAEPRMLYAMEVDYRAFVEHLTYTPPPPRK